MSSRVLLAESSTIVLEIERQYLQESEVSIFTASRAEEVIKVARKVRPALVYLAFSLPTAGGESCCRELKADPGLRGIPVVMVCASAEEKQRARDAGCDAAIGKPMEKREFLEAGLPLLSAAPPEDARISCRSLVQCTQGEESFFGTIEDVSMDGMFVASQRRLVPGEVLLLRFLLPWSGAGLIKTAAQVSWVNSGRQPRNKRLPPGFGVNFQGVDAHAADQISDYLELMRKRLGSDADRQ